MRQLLLPLLIFFSWTADLPAQAQIDSLKNLIVSTTAPEVISDLYGELTWEYISLESDSALLMSQVAEKRALESGYLKGVAIAREFQGIYHEMVVNDYDKAAEIYLDAINYSDENKLGYSGDIYHSLGILFHMSDSYEKGKFYYSKSLDLAKENGDTSLIRRCLTNLGTVTSSMGDNEGARKLLLQSLDYPQTAYDRSVIFGSIGNSFYRENNFEEAITWFMKSVEPIDGELVAPDVILCTYILDCKTALKSKTDLSEWILKTEEKLKQTDVLRDQNIAYKSLANANKELGAFERSSNYFELYISSYDELKTKQRDELVYELEEKFKTEQKNQELKISTARNKYLGIGLGILTLALVALTYFFIGYKNKSKALSHSNAQLAKSNEDKTLLLKEIHHRVKNNLQTISSMLKLQSNTIADPEVKRLFGKGQDRVRAIALLHKNLYQEETLAGVNTKDYIEELAESLIRSSLIDQKNIKVELDIDELLLDIDSAIPIGLIINELFSNAMKHAFEEKEKGTIRISFKDQGDRLFVQVADNGKGHSENNLSEAEGLGIKLIKAFSKKLKAKLSISGKEGTAIQLEIHKFKRIIQQ